MASRPHGWPARARRRSPSSSVRPTGARSRKAGSMYRGQRSGGSMMWMSLSRILNAPCAMVASVRGHRNPRPRRCQRCRRSADIMHPAMDARVADALHTILPIAGWGEDRARAVEITGDTDPILPTPFRIGETSAAALAAVGLAGSELRALPPRRGQDVPRDTRQPPASLATGHYFKMGGAHVSTERNAATGVYPAQNGRQSY